MGRGYEKALNDLRASLARGNPQYADELNRINTGFANYARIRQAGSMANTQERFTPAQLAAAVKSLDKTKGGTATGQALMQDLTDAGVKALQPGLPTSGTSERILATSLPNYLAGMALAAPYSQTGRKVSQYLITQRPESARNLAELLKLNPELATGTAVGIQRKLGE